MLTVDFSHFIEQQIYLVLCISLILTAILVVFLSSPLMGWKHMHVFFSTLLTLFSFAKGL